MFAVAEHNRSDYDSGMTLEHYRRANDLTMRELAKKLGLSLGFTSDLTKRKATCSLDVAVKIEKLTKGAVSCRDLIKKTEAA